MEYVRPVVYNWTHSVSICRFHFPKTSSGWGAGVLLVFFSALVFVSAFIIGNRFLRFAEIHFVSLHQKRSIFVRRPCRGESVAAGLLDRYPRSDSREGSERKLAEW